LPAATETGRVALDQVIERGWLQPVDDDLSRGPDVLVAEFLAAFPDGTVVDLQTRAGRRAARILAHNLLVTLLPSAMRSLGQGAVVVQVSDHWMTPAFYEGKLRMIFVLPADVDTNGVRRWRRSVNTWNACGSLRDVSHVHSG
jgi:hypothetical protein